MAGELRGSIQVLKKRWASPLPDDALETVARAIDIDGVKPNDVFCLGTPEPEFITGTLTARRDSFDRVVNNLLNIEVCRLIDLEAFPCGIPEIDEVRANFRIGR